MSRRGDKNSNWRGGRRRGGHGMRYWQVYAPDHPRASKAGTVLEHRLVAEKKLGRYLEPGEIVHHINGDTLDNRPENIEVMTQSEHARLHYPEKFAPFVPKGPRLPRERRTCPTCDEEFEVRITIKQTYCSRACYFARGQAA